VRLRHVLLGLLAFAIALLIVFPVAWLRSALPPGITCGSLSGSIWTGQCNTLEYTQSGRPSLRLDTLAWKLHPLSLLRGRVQADVSLASPDLSASGEMTLQSAGRMSLAGFSGTISLDHAKLAALPAGWSAQAEARELSLDISAGRLQALGGVLLARQLRDSRGTAYGDFQLQFPRQDSAPFRGALIDQGGPMQLQSQLLLNADQSWQLRGTVVLRPGSPQELAGALDQLATADLNGVRTFSLEGTAR
jgi:Type II secretion system (T2SS), protein N